MPATQVILKWMLPHIHNYTQLSWPSCSIWRAKVQTKSLIKWQLGKKYEIIFELVFYNFLITCICFSRNEKNHTCCHKLVNVLFIFHLFTVKRVAVRLNKSAKWQEKERQLMHRFFLTLTFHHNISQHSITLQLWYLHLFYFTELI